MLANRIEERVNIPGNEAEGLLREHIEAAAVFLIGLQEVKCDALVVVILVDVLVVDELLLELHVALVLLEFVHFTLLAKIFHL